MNVPNKLSLVRLFTIPFIILAFYIEFPYHYIVTCVLFGFAAFTDFLDGHIARKYGLVTDLGKFLDSSADKVLVLSTLILLIDKDLITGSDLPSFIGGVFVSIVLAREIMISCLRMVIASKGIVMAADKLGKFKTVLQDIALVLFLLAGEFSNNGTIGQLIEQSASLSVSNAVYAVIFYTGFSIFTLAIIMTVVSAVHYICVYAKDLGGKS